MRQITLLAVLVLSGCANTDWLWLGERSGYRNYDPCIKCGEKWVQLPNEPFEAQKMQYLCKQGVNPQLNCY